MQSCTRSGTRTHTAVRPLVPETSASTDSAIRACLEDCETVVCFSFAGAKIVIFHRISKFYGDFFCILCDFLYLCPRNEE